MSKPGAALSELSDLLGAISHPDRLRLLLELRGAPRDVASLTAACSLSQSRTSQHLGLLKAHHLVQAEREGRRVYYSLARPGLAEWLIAGLDFIGPEQTLHDAIREMKERYRQPD